MTPFTLERTRFDLLEARLFGFWEPDEVPRFQLAVAQAVAAFGGESFCVIVDLSETKVQTAEVIVAQSETVAWLVASGMRKLVVLGSSALLAMQVRRATTPASATIFVATMAEALAEVDAEMAAAA